MAGIGDLVGMMMQGGLSSAGQGRVGNALGQGGLGQAGGLLEQVLGGGGSGGGALGGILNAAKGMLGGGSGASVGGNPLATGGLGALAGALFGGSGLKGAMGGGAMAMLAGLAFQAFKNRNRQPQGAGMSFATNEPPLGMRAPANTDEEREIESTAELVLRGMMNAAKADGQIDNDEIQKIAGRLKEAGASNEDQQQVLQELGRPLDLDGLVSDIPNEAVAAQVYLASLFAIKVDTDAEREYLNQLAGRTGLDSGVREQLHQAVGVS